MQHATCSLQHATCNIDAVSAQAFSHFTLEESAHELVVCDIQGVGDLYTDPQIHSSDGGGCVRVIY